MFRKTGAKNDSGNGHDTSTPTESPIRAFLAQHSGCGALTFDTPTAADRIAFRLTLACACGDRFEALIGSFSLEVSEVQQLLQRAA